MKFLSRFDKRTFLGTALPTLSGQAIVVVLTLISGARLYHNYWLMQGAFVAFFVLLGLATSWFVGARRRGGR